MRGEGYALSIHARCVSACRKSTTMHSRCGYKLVVTPPQGVPLENLAVPAADFEKYASDEGRLGCPPNVWMSENPGVGTGPMRRFLLPGNYASQTFSRHNTSLYETPEWAGLATAPGRVLHLKLDDGAQAAREVAQGWFSLPSGARRMRCKAYPHLPWGGGYTQGIAACSNPPTRTTTTHSICARQ